MKHLGAAFIPQAPRRDTITVGPWPTPLPAWFWTWAAWRDHGGIPAQRPASLPERIPAWAWLRYAVHRGPAKPKLPPVVDPVPPHVPRTRFTGAIIAAQNPMTALNTPYWMPIFLTADPAYRKWVTQQFLVTAKNQQRPLGAWGNPLEVSPAAIRQFARDFGIAPDMLMGQAESAEQFDVSVEAKFPAVVGSTQVLNDSQKKFVNDGGTEFLQEDYWNVMPWLVPDWQGVKCTCSIPGLYKGEGPYGRYVPCLDYITAGRMVNGRDGFYHASGPSDNGDKTIMVLK